MENEEKSLSAGFNINPGLVVEKLLLNQQCIQFTLSEVLRRVITIERRSENDSTDTESINEEVSDVLNQVVEKANKQLLETIAELYSKSE